MCLVCIYFSLTLCWRTGAFGYDVVLVSTVRQPCIHTCLRLSGIPPIPATTEHWVGFPVLYRIRAHQLSILHMISSFSFSPHSGWHSLGPFHIATNGPTVFLLTAEQYYTIFPHSSVGTESACNAAARLHSTVCVHHSFFIHYFISGSLGCFHALAITNGSAGKLGYMYFFELCFHLGICPIVEFLGHLLVLFLVF